MALISTRNMSIGFGGHALLRNIDLDIERGEIVALIGPNGSGKTTLLRTLIGALQPSSGSVSREAGVVVGYVPQRLHVDETLPMTVYRFLQLPVRHGPEELAVALERAGVPSLGGQQLGTLSGGQFQRVLLARAVLDKPDILLLDEASQGLDHAGAKDFYRQIGRIQQELGCAIILVSHELKVVMQTASRVICLNETICCEGPPEAVVSTLEYRSLFGIDDDREPTNKRNVYSLDSRNGNAINA